MTWHSFSHKEAKSLLQVGPNATLVSRQTRKKLSTSRSLFQRRYESDLITSRGWICRFLMKPRFDMSVEQHLVPTRLSNFAVSLLVDHLCSLQNLQEWKQYLNGVVEKLPVTFLEPWNVEMSLPSPQLFRKNRNWNEKCHLLLSCPRLGFFSFGWRNWSWGRILAVRTKTAMLETHIYLVAATRRPAAIALASLMRSKVLTRWRQHWRTPLQA